MEGVTIRKAFQVDLSTLRQFEQGVIRAERPFDSTLKEDPILYYELEEMLEDPNVALVVAEHKGRIIASGYARIQLAKPMFKHGRYAYLGFMYTLPEYRGKGINRIIIEALKQWTISQGITEMRLEVYVGNDPAIKAYEKIGFTQHLIEMRLGI